MEIARVSWNSLRLAVPLQLPLRGPKALFTRFAHRRPNNEHIPHDYVQVVNEDGKLEPPVLLSTLLANLNRKRFIVELVTDERPIVKILDKQKEYEKHKALRKARKVAERAPEQKEIQMTWGVAAGDLAHKLDKVRKELVKKNRVDLVFAPKKRQPVPPPVERDAKVDEVLRFLKDVGKESRPRTFQRALLTLHLQGLSARVTDTGL